MAAAQVIRVCSVEGCENPRAIVRVKGVRKRAPMCGEHVIEARQASRPQAKKKRPYNPRKPCGANRKGKSPCNRPAGWATGHPGFGRCKFHGGSTPSGEKAGAKDEARARAVVMGAPIDVDPMDAILHCIRVSAGEVAYTSAMVSDLEAEQATITYHEEGYTPGEFGGSFSKDTTDVKLHIWIAARREAMDRLAKFSKMAIDAGIAERTVKVAEHWGTSFARMLEAFAEHVQLTPAQKQRAPEAMRLAQATIDGTTVE